MPRMFKIKLGLNIIWLGNKIKYRNTYKVSSY